MNKPTEELMKRLEHKGFGDTDINDILQVLQRMDCVFLAKDQAPIGTPRACKNSQKEKAMVESWLLGYRRGQKVLVDNNWHKTIPIDTGKKELLCPEYGTDDCKDCRIRLPGCITVKLKEQKCPDCGGSGEEKHMDRMCHKCKGTGKKGVEI